MAEEAGQDLVEYALLAAFIGISGAAALALLAQAIGAAYVRWDTSVNDAWEPPPPGS